MKIQQIKIIINFIIRFIKKGQEIDNYTKEYIKSIEKWINNYPRKLFEYKSTVEILRRKKR